MKKLTLKEFVAKAVAIHGDKYNYDNVVYINSQTKVGITCPIHGVFKQSPAMHLQGQGCPQCKAEKTSERFVKTQDAFIQQAVAIHGDRYDYSKVQYNGTHAKVCITCNKCGKEFFQTPHNHLEGQTCPWCAGKKKNTEMFKDELRNIYGDIYNLDDVVYVNAATPVKLVCSKHGAFEKKPKDLLCGRGCVSCGNESAARKLSEQKRYTQDDFVRISKEKHGDKYDYSQSKYICSSSKVYIICPDHGGFWQIAGEHMQGTACPKCAGHNKTTEEFKEQLKAVHGNTYILDKVVYVNAETKVCMVCKKHGDFFVIPNNVLNGNGCPQCHRHKGEERVEKYLKENGIDYIPQQVFPNESLLAQNKSFRVDFYLPKNNAIIEYNGGQHYFPVKIFGGENAFEKQQDRDLALRIYCKRHKIKLIEIPYTDFGKIEYILNNKLGTNNCFKKNDK